MENEKLKKCMMSFSIEELKGFLGYDLVDSLLEWNDGNEAFINKKRLVNMIISIYGTSILKNKDFRKRLLKTFSRDNILDFRGVLPKKYSESDDLNVIINVATNTPRKNNNVNGLLLRLLDYMPDDVFAKDDNTNSPLEVVNSNGKFYELLDYQYIIRQRALNILESNNELCRFLIHMPTGTGKTKTASHIICHHFVYNMKKRGMILWIAHTTELLDQALATIGDVWRNIGDGELRIYKLWAGYSFEIPEEEFSGIMICSIQKLQSLQNSNTCLFNKIVEDTRLLVYDEAHKASAPETRNVIERIMTKPEGFEDRSLMGLSATPGRTTEQSFDNDLLASTFGNKIISVDTRLMNMVNMSMQEAINKKPERDVISFFQERGILSRIIKEELVYQQNFTDEELRRIQVETTSNGYEDFTKAALEILGKNKSRNQRILQRLRELNASGVPTIVFACSVKHAQLLSAMLTLEKIPNGVVYSGMPIADRNKTIEKFKDVDENLNILINYEILTTGFDATNIECVFIARPTQSVVLYSQMLGRGLRGPQMGGKSKCLLIDVQDNLKQFNVNMAYSHFNNYWGE